MSEFIKCDGCGRMAKKDLTNGPREWSTIEITTHRNNGIFGEDPSTYHVCPECHKELEQGGCKKCYISSHLD